MPDTKLPFKEMCARFDVTPRTLRYYEYIELLSPIRQGRSRYYTQREIARMTLILRGRKFGFTLEEIRQWLLIYETDGTEAQMRVFHEMANRQIDILNAQYEELGKTVQELRDLLHETQEYAADQSPDDKAPDKTPCAAQRSSTAPRTQET